MLLAVYVASKTEAQAAATLQDLRRRLADERRRWEWQRAIRMRHYVTLDCLKDPEEAPWMATGIDTNFIAVMSLSRYGSRFLALYLQLT
jgi:hypothetical protein